MVLKIEFLKRWNNQCYLLAWICWKRCLEKESKQIFSQMVVGFNGQFTRGIESVKITLRQIQVKYIILIHQQRLPYTIPIGSMGRTVYLPIHGWLILMVNVGKYTIHDAMGFLKYYCINKQFAPEKMAAGKTTFLYGRWHPFILRTVSFGVNQPFQ